MNMEDIAKLAKVSKSAVSLALNGKPGVSDKTRKRIIKIAENHGYIPKTPSRLEKGSKSNSRFFRFLACTNTGIVTEQYESLSFFMELINNIEKSVSAKGYSLIVSSVDTKNIAQEIVRLEHEQRSAGILLLGTNLTAEQIKIVANTQPNIVVLDTCIDTLEINFVVMNNMLGAYQATKHLINLGHKNIGYVESIDQMYNFRMRKKGFSQAINEHNLSTDKKHVFSVSPILATSQEDFKRQITNAKGNLPSALFCDCDYIAINVIKALTKMNINVPEKISVIGFDNIFESQIISPELTTIHVKKDKMARIAVNKLISYIEDNEDTKVKLFIDTKLVIRNSCTRYQSTKMETANP